MENKVVTPEEVKFLLEAYYTYCIEVIIGKPADQWDQEIKNDLILIANRRYDKETQKYTKTVNGYMKDFDVKKGKYKSSVVEQTDSARILKNMLDFRDCRSTDGSCNSAADIISKYQSGDPCVRAAFLRKWKSLRYDKQLSKISDAVDALRDQRNVLIGHNTDTISDNRRKAYLYSAIYFINLFKSLSDAVNEESDLFENWTDPDGERQRVLEYYDEIANNFKEDIYQEERRSGSNEPSDIIFSYRKKKYHISKEKESDYRDLIMSMARDWKVMRDHFLNDDFLDKFKAMFIEYTGDTYNGINLDRLCKRLNDAVEKNADGEVVIILTMMVNLFLPDAGFYIRGRYVSEKTIAEKLLYIPFLTKRGENLTWDIVINNIDNSHEWAPWGNRSDRNGLGLSLKNVAYHRLFSTYYEFLGDTKMQKTAKDWETCILDLIEAEKTKDWDSWCEPKNIDVLRRFTYLVNGSPFCISWNGSGEKLVLHSMKDVHKHFLAIDDFETLVKEVTYCKKDVNFNGMLKFTKDWDRETRVNGTD